MAIKSLAQFNGIRRGDFAARKPQSADSLFYNADVQLRSAAGEDADKWDEATYVDYLVSYVESQEGVKQVFPNPKVLKAQAVQYVRKSRK